MPHSGLGGLGPYLLVVENETIVAVTDELAALFGYEAGELIGRRSWSLVRVSNSRQTRLRAATREPGSEIRETATAVHRDGHEFPLPYTVREVNGFHILAAHPPPETTYTEIDLDDPDVQATFARWDLELLDGLVIGGFTEAHLDHLTSLRRIAPTSTPKSGKSEHRELQMSQADSYLRRPMVTAEIKWDTLGGRLIEARTRRGLTRRQLAGLTGSTSETTVRRYEDGEVTAPREDVVRRFATALGCDPVWLMYGRGEPCWDPDWKHPKLG